MKRSTIQDAMFPGCPMRNILARLCDKWALLVIYILDRSGKESLRFMALKQQMPDISQRMLSLTLRTLEEDGYVTRTIFPEIPPRVEYALTARAKSLKPILDSLLQWSVDNMNDIMCDRKKSTSVNNQ
ncbi:MAG TPA: helix-turn-helix transcriptional regulator [Candidatus Barnesiella excrementavium]|nr:helix-turn-helix transcriptional regulator [Candidatus Barnesiella excrementavium]